MRVYDDNGLTEQEYLERYAKKQYPKPSLTADIVILSKDADAYSVLLVRRRNHPFLDFWALPGGFTNPNEPVEQTAARELAEETGVEGLPLRLVGGMVPHFLAGRQTPAPPPHPRRASYIAACFRSRDDPLRRAENRL